MPAMSARVIAVADLLRLAEQAQQAPEGGLSGSQAEFARFLGCDKSHVTRLKQLGQLVMADERTVDFAASLLRLAEHADPARDAQRAAAGSETPEKPPPPAPGGPQGAPNDEDEDQGPKYAESRATKEYWAARTAQVEYERMVGALVQREHVVKAIADAAAMFRQAVENQPHRLADRVVGLPLDRVRALLRDDGQQMLAELSRGFAKRLAMAAEGEGVKP